MDNFIQELEEDLRHDRYLALWRKYGRYATALALAIVIAAAGVVAWRHYRESERLKESMAYNAALSVADQGGAAWEGALYSLRDLAQSGSTAYGTLARFQEAALLNKNGKPDEAAAIYDSMSKDKAVDPLFRDLAALLHVMVMLDKGDPQQLAARLAPLTESRDPWRYSALELQALLAQRTGDTAKAREIYANLADDPTAPRQLRGRAAEMLAMLGSAAE
jgi:hypothetical protein